MVINPTSTTWLVNGENKVLVKVKEVTGVVFYVLSQTLEC